MSDKDTVKVERYIPIVAGAGFVGLVTSLILLSDYSGPLLDLVSEYLEHLSS